MQRSSSKLLRSVWLASAGLASALALLVLADGDDLDLFLEIKVINNELAFFISPNTEKCHFHIMKDNVGNLGLFDHSNLVNDIIVKLPVILGGSLGGPTFTMGLKSFEPLFVLNSLENPIHISAGEGYLYIDMNALDVDFSLLKGVLVAPL